MRKIICLCRVGGSLSPEELEECCKHSFLVEPRNEQEVLVDLSSFKKVGSIIDSITSITAFHGQKTVIGVASAPLFAIIAARSYLLPLNGRCRRIFHSHGIPVIEVVPGKEAQFLVDLPVEEFYPLTGKEQRLLKRMGYSRVGELAVLSPQRMEQIIKRDAALLSKYCHGIDFTPVQGLYPPGCISYALTVPEGCQDLLQLHQMNQIISMALAEKLKPKHLAFRRIRVEMITAADCKSWEKTLTEACQEAVRMEHILNGLIKLDPGRPAEEIRVTLTRLERAEMHMPDLFSWRAVPTDQNRQIKNAVVHLQQKYPNCIQVGIIPERREQVLALWDPWRMR